MEILLPVGGSDYAKRMPSSIARPRACCGRSESTPSSTAGQFDLTVMESHGHGHGSLAGMVLGSVATGVPARCMAPVLLLR